jgi:hypothetical protein
MKVNTVHIMTVISTCNDINSLHGMSAGRYMSALLVECSTLTSRTYAERMTQMRSTAIER